jgi:hypothetical protein
MPAENVTSRFGPLIWTVLLLDTVPCLLGLFFGGQELFHGISSFASSPAAFFAHYGFIFGLALCGLCGNTLILLRKRAGVPLAVAGIVIDLVSVGAGLWSNRHVSWFGWPDSYAFQLGVELARTGWLVFYGAVVRMAARKMRLPSCPPIYPV